MNKIPTTDSIFSTKTVEQATVPQDIIEKLKIETERINKDSKVTFRVTTELYEKLDAMATIHNLSMSRLMEALTKEHLNMLSIEYALSGYLNTFSDVMERMIDAEKDLPVEFRLYTKIVNKYPDATLIDRLKKDEELEKTIVAKKAEGEAVTE